MNDTEDDQQVIVDDANDVLIKEAEGRGGIPVSQEDSAQPIITDYAGN